MPWPNSKLRRFIVNSIVVWTMLGLYMFINHHQAPPPNTVLMPSWVPFWPAFFPFYFAMMFVTWLLPVAIRDAGCFRACLRANICAWLLVMPWWILSPTMMPRPASPEGAWAYVFDWVWTADQPYNVRPCAHGIGPVVAAWFVAQDHPSWRWLVAGMVGLGLSSIALVWQHRPIDILLGTVAAFVGIAVGTALSRREQAHASWPPSSFGYAAMKVSRKHWLVCVSAVILPLIGGWFAFSVASPLNRHSAIRTTLEWARLAPFPVPASSLHVQVSGSMFSKLRPRGIGQGLGCLVLSSWR